MQQFAAGCRTSIISFDHAFLTPSPPEYQQLEHHPADRRVHKKPNSYRRFFSKVKSMASSSDSFPPAALKDVANEVAALLKERKETAAVAETVGFDSIRR
jgi:hypothetical protein